MQVEDVSLGRIKPFPNNPRRGNVKAIADSLATFGQYKPITVNRRTSEILAGNHTYEAARLLGWTTIAVAFVNVDDETAAKIVAIDNRASDMGEYDNDALIKLLGDLESLSHTGYSYDDLDDLLAAQEEDLTPTLRGDMTIKLGSDQGDERGVTKIGNLDDLIERYNDRATRMLVLDYPLDIYVWIVAKFTEIRQEYGFTSNAEAALFLLEQYTEEKAPTA